MLKFLSSDDSSIPSMMMDTLEIIVTLVTLAILVTLVTLVTPVFCSGHKSALQCREQHHFGICLNNKIVILYYVYRASQKSDYQKFWHILGKVFLGVV